MLRERFRNVGIAKDSLRAAAFALLGIGSVLLITACGGGGGASGPSTSGAVPSTSGSATNPDSGTIDAGGTGQVTVAWTSTPVNIDGSCSAGIQGYRVNAGLSPGFYAYSTMVYNSQISCSAISTSACGDVQRCTYTVQGLTSASWYIAIQSVDVFGNESGYSEEIVATVY